MKKSFLLSLLFIALVILVTTFMSYGAYIYIICSVTGTLLMILALIASVDSITMCSEEAYALPDREFLYSFCKTRVYAYLLASSLNLLTAHIYTILF